ncbi:response regulator, partial [Acinetobacter baumannii]
NLRGGEKSWAIADALDDADMPFLFASGGEEASMPERHRGRSVLIKPFTMDAIARALDLLRAGQ